MAFNNTLQSVANYCSTQAALIPLSGVGGYANEPFLSIVNQALSDLLTTGDNWKINRNETGFGLLVTMQNKQDYLYGGASAFTLTSTVNGQGQGAAIALASNNGITVSGGVVTVNTLEPHRFNVGDSVFLTGCKFTTGTAASYNSVLTNNGQNSTWTGSYVITSVPNSQSFTFAAISGQNNGDVGGAPGITDFGWATDASMVMMTDTSSPQFAQTLYTYRELPVSHRVANPEKIAVQRDNGDGTIVVRFYLVPGAVAWGATIIYQRQAPVKTDLTNNWFPFPDHYSAVYRQAVIYQMYRYINSSQQNAEYLKLQEEIKKVQASDDAEQTDVHVKPLEPLMDASTWWWGW